MNLVHLADCTPVPWRNGGGVTQDLLTLPAAGDGWQLRVSVALIDRAGPFSRFDGISRWFTVLDGAGVRLDLPAGPITLRPGDSPIHFDGADAPGCALLAGPTHDLNFMAPFAAGRCGLRQAWPGDAVDTTTRWRGLYTAGPACLRVGDVEHSLSSGTLAWSSDAVGPPWQLIEGGPAWFMTLEQR